MSGGIEPVLGALKDWDGAVLSSGNLILNGTSWADVGVPDLTLDAEAGDTVEVMPQGRLAAGGGATHTFFDVATVVGGSPVSYFGTGGGASDEGVNGWRAMDIYDCQLSGSVLRTLDAGDIQGGQVTLRLRYRQDTAGDRTFVAAAVNPFKWWARNLGQVRAATIGALGNGTTGLVDFAYANRTAGDITGLNSTSWANVDTGMDLVLTAAAGDVIEASVAVRVSAQYLDLDVATIVSGAPVNAFSTGSAESGSGQGIQGWSYTTSEASQSKNGSYMYTLTAGDISGGTVTLRLRYKVNSGSKTIYASPANGIFQFSAKNLGAPPA